MSKSKMQIIKVDEENTRYEHSMDEATITITREPLKKTTHTKKITTETLDLPHATGVPNAPDISMADLEDVNTMLRSCITLLEPYITNFSSDELKRMRRLGMKRRSYFNIASMYLIHYEELIPPGVNLSTFNQLLSISQEIENTRYAEKLIDNQLKMLEAHFETIAYSTFSMIYDYVKMLAKSNNPIAKQVYEMLKPLFSRKKPNSAANNTNDTVVVKETIVAEEIITPKEEIVKMM